MKWIGFLLLAVFLFMLANADDTTNQPVNYNPLSVLDYGDIDGISWYGWFVIVYSFFVVIIVGSAIFLP